MTGHATIPPSTVILKEIIRRIERFQALLKKAQTLPAPRTVHDIRISIRRLEAAADFYSTLTDGHLPARTAAALESLMRPLGKLRDLHVQSELIGRHLSGKSPVVVRFTQKVRSRMARREAQVLRAIRRFPLKGLALFAAAVREDLAGGVPEAHMSEKSLRRLALGAQRPVEAYRKRYVSTRGMKTFHKMRIALKHLRYTGEMLVPVVPEITARDVERIHALQREMGTVHDAEVLAVSLKKYFAKKDGGPEAKKQLRKIIVWRDGLLKKINRTIGTYRFFHV